MSVKKKGFWFWVNKTDTCWLWEGNIATNSYGLYTANFSGQRQTKRAHRLAYELMVGPIPDGLELDHLCRVRNCVNPAHLEAVTHQENVLRGGKVCVVANLREPIAPEVILMIFQIPMLGRGAVEPVEPVADFWLGATNKGGSDATCSNG